MNKASITFYGGAGSVTGANFLFDIHPVRESTVQTAASNNDGKFSNGVKILIDCGAVQREHACDEENAAPFAYDPASVDVLIVTHAHQDHIGRIPKLVRDGFKGVIYSTAATKELAALMFDDAVAVMHRNNTEKGCAVIYELPDAHNALSLWNTHEYHEPFSIGSANVEFLDAGHILGSAMVRCTRENRTIVFTGDVGNTPEPLLNDVENIEGANYILMESVYGDRMHEHRDDRAVLFKAAIESARQRGGALLIPSFSIERTQILLSELNTMIEQKAIEPIPVFLDAPLATRVTEVFRAHVPLLNPATRARVAEHDDPFEFPGLKVIATTAQSHAIEDAPNPKIIIAGAGMSSGGRIRAHEKNLLPDPSSTILFVGYQAPGSLGRRIADGEKSVHIDGTHVPVRAHIEQLTGYSGHADREGLLSLVESAGQSLEKVFVAMGEPKAELFLAQRIKDFLGVPAEVPEHNQTVEIQW